MGKIGLWFWFSCKRQLKKPGFVLILLLLPLAFGGMERLEKKDGGRIPVAMYVEGGSLALETADALTRDGGMFQFYLCESEREMRDDVASKKAECGYLFFDGLEKKLDGRKAARSIGVYSSPSTVTASLSTEVVFSRLFEVYGRELLRDYTVGDELFADLNREEAWPEMEQLYEKYYQNGSTFSFRYGTEAGGALPQKQTAKAVFPVRGLAAVCVFVTGLFSAVTLGTDEKKGLFIPVPYGVKKWCRLACLAGPTTLAACSGLAAVWISGYGLPGAFGTVKEIAVMLVYALAVSVFAYVLKLIFRNPAVLSGTIPFLAMGSLILCPVFLDVSAWIPGLGALSKLFLPWYYLKCFL